MNDALDEFESIFKRAEREQFVFADIPIDSIAIVTDQDLASGEKAKAEVIEFIPRLADAESWRIIAGDQLPCAVTLIEVLRNSLCGIRLARRAIDAALIV
jgi:hypothetical protein